jgi:hypothetical protein
MLLGRRLRHGNTFEDFANKDMSLRRRQAVSDEARIYA